MKSAVSNSGRLCGDSMASRAWFLSCSVILDNTDGSRQMLEFPGCREKEDGEEGSFQDSFLKIAHDASSTCMPLATLPCLTATEAWKGGLYLRRLFPATGERFYDKRGKGETAVGGQ